MANRVYLAYRFSNRQNVILKYPHDKSISGKAIFAAHQQEKEILTHQRVTTWKNGHAYLANAVLPGLALNALFGWWWANLLASFVVIYYSIREVTLQESKRSKA